jgi:hypothetical protein
MTILKKIEEPKPAEITTALGIMTPLVESLVISAEKSGAPGNAKHEAVSRALEPLYRALQKSIKELRGVPWEAIEPYIVEVGTGLVSAIVEMFNSLFSKLWGKLREAWQ